MTARVQVVNKRQVETPHRNRRGQRTGTDFVTVHDGFRALCQPCGWRAEITQFATVASAGAAQHNDERHEPRTDSEETR